MKKTVRKAMPALACIVLVLFCCLPVAGVVAIGSSASSTTPSANTTSTEAAKPFISSTISSRTPLVGDPVTISGVATGGDEKAGVQIWVFAGNYVNVSTVPVNAAGLPPATYYVFVQNPGPDGKYAIVLQDSGIFSGQVVNSLTGTLIFNFTGTGSIQDAAAAQALSSALSSPGMDDVYTKITFQLVAPSASAPATPVSTAASAFPMPSATKSPLAVITITGALAATAVCAAAVRRKNR